MKLKQIINRARKYSSEADPDSKFVVGMLDSFYDFCDENTGIAQVQEWQEYFADFKEVVDRNQFPGDFAIAEKMATLLERWVEGLRQEEGDSILNQLHDEKDS